MFALENRAIRIFHLSQIPFQKIIMLSALEQRALITCIMTRNNKLPTSTAYIISFKKLTLKTDGNQI